MKLVCDKSLEGKNRRIVTFSLQDLSSGEVAFALISAFSKASVVAVSPFGEHRLPAARCADLAVFEETLGNLKLTSIEIGESSGYCPYSFIIHPGEDLECYGPLDFDFYALIKNSGLNFTL
ncbi:MAG: hypothetical protein IJJ61_06840 [Clostridia bacterium]|nr:hypothetical protein [Clostridia bacterium]MBR6335999.1 hypothetical protein [Clostridia bacterium]